MSQFSTVTKRCFFECASLILDPDIVLFPWNGRLNRYFSRDRRDPGFCVSFLSLQSANITPRNTF